MAAEAVRFASDICIFAGASEGVLQRTRPQAGTRARSGGAGYYARASFAGTRPSPGRSLKLAYAGPPPTPHGVQGQGTRSSWRRARERAERSSASPCVGSVRRAARGHTRRHKSDTQGGDAARCAAAVAIPYKGGEGVLAGGVQASDQGDGRVPAELARA